MNEHKNIRDYLGITDLKSFNQKVADVLKDDNKSTDSSNPQESGNVSQSVSFDANKFQTSIVLPDVLDENTLYQLTDLIDGKVHYENELVDEENEISDFASPNTVDQMMNSIGVIYITEEANPVAVATLSDPTIQNYRGVIPIDYYELKSGQSLYGRVQIETFAIKPEYKNAGLEGELRNLIDEVAPEIFAVVPLSDLRMMELMQSSGYKPISQFQTDWDLTPVVLWIN